MQLRLLLLAILFATGCENGNSGVQPTHNVPDSMKVTYETAENTIIINQGLANGLISVSSGKIVVKAGSALAGQVRKGSGLVAGITSKTPYGLLTKVSNIKNDAQGNLILSMQPAGLTELFSVLKLDASFGLQPGDVDSVECNSDDGPQAGPGRHGWSAGMQVDATLKNAVGTTNHLKQDLSVFAGMYISIDIEKSGLKRLVVRPVIETMASFEGDGVTDYRGTWYSNRECVIHFKPVSAGSIVLRPSLVIMPFARWFHGGSVKADIYMDGRMDATLTRDATGKWDQDTTEPNFQAWATGPSVTNGGDFDTSVSVSLDVEFNGTREGVYGKLSPGMEVRSLSVWGRGLWTLYAVASGEAGLWFDQGAMIMDNPVYRVGHFLGVQNDFDNSGDVVETRHRWSLKRFEHRVMANLCGDQKCEQEDGEDCGSCPSDCKCEYGQTCVQCECAGTPKQPPKGACVITVTPEGKHVNYCSDADLVFCDLMKKKGNTAVFHQGVICKDLGTK